MSEQEVLLEMHDLRQSEVKVNEDIENDLVLFKLLRKITSAFSQNKINFKKIEFLRTKYEILQTMEVFKVLDNKDRQHLSSPESKNKFKKEVQTVLLNEFFEKCLERKGDKSSLCFFAAASCNEKQLIEIIRDCDPEALNKPKYCDSVLVFTLKYGDISGQKFFECVDHLIEAKVDINKPDFNGKTAIQHVVIAFKRSKDEIIKRKLQALIEKLIQKGVFWELVDEYTKSFIKKINNGQLSETQMQDENTINQLFCWIGRGKSQEFLQFSNIKQFVNCNNGEMTLLQFACIKSEKMHSVIKFLLKNGANPNLYTQENKHRPLEITARRKHDQNFTEILKNKKLKISEDIFNNFVKWRSNSVKNKYFEMLLESDKLDPNCTSETSGSTPLHYAVCFSYKKVVQKILKRSENCLHVPNNAGKSVFDIIDADDLQDHFDNYCIALDTYTNDFGSDDYKMHLRFKSLISTRNDQIDEVEALSKISKNKNLDRLLTHPLIHTFIVLKWSKVEFYYWLLFFLQFILFVNLGICCYYLSDTSSCTRIVCAAFLILDFILKIPFIVASHFSCKCQYLSLYEFMEVLLILTFVGAFFSIEFQAFAVVEMSILLLLTAGYHPKIAKWTVMLKKVFKTFTILMAFFSLVIAAFAFAIHLPFKKESHKSFETIWKSLFMTYIMLTGEFNLNKNFRFTGMGGYVLFFFFAIFVASVLVNFWTGVAVTDISSVEKNAEINAFKNVITFLEFVEKRIYGRKLLRMCFPSPILFSDKNNKYEVDFYINRKNQFGNRKSFSHNVGEDCLHKIKLFCSRKMDVSNEKDISSRLERLEKTLNEIKNANSSRSATTKYNRS